MKSAFLKSITRTIAIVFLIHQGAAMMYLIFILVTIDPCNDTGKDMLSLSELHSIVAIISIPYAIYDISKNVSKNRRK